MAKEAVDKIKDAEAKAEHMRVNAYAEAKKIRQKAEEDAAQLINSKKDEAYKKSEEIINAARKNAEKITREALNGLNPEFDKLSELIKKNSASVANELVNMI